MAINQKPTQNMKLTQYENWSQNKCIHLSIIKSIIIIIINNKLLFLENFSKTII